MRLRLSRSTESLQTGGGSWFGNDVLLFFPERVYATLLCNTAAESYIAARNIAAKKDGIVKRVRRDSMMRRFFMFDRNSSTATRSALALFILAAAVLIASIGAQARDQDDAPAAAFRRVCSSCHDAERILSTRRTRTQWEEVIEKMIDRGAEGTSDDFTTAEEYLLRVSGRVNANRAASKDMVTVLGITQKDADAIVEYRKANGEFKDFDGLSKVPGIDLEKLKQGRDAISF